MTAALSFRKSVLRVLVGRQEQEGHPARNLHKTINQFYRYYCFPLVSFSALTLLVD